MFSIWQSDYIISSINIVNGNVVMVIMFCSVFRLLVSSSVLVISVMVMFQIMWCDSGGLFVLLVDMLVSISIVELAEVIKKMISSISVIIDSIVGSGRLLNMVNSMVLQLLFRVCVRFMWLKICDYSVVLLNIENYRKFSMFGVIIMFSMNLWMLCLCDMWVMNEFMNGVYVIYYVQQKIVQLVIQVLFENGDMCRFIVISWFRYELIVVVKVLKMKLVGFSISISVSSSVVRVRLMLDSYLMLWCMLLVVEVMYIMKVMVMMVSCMGIEVCMLNMCFSLVVIWMVLKFSVVVMLIVVVIMVVIFIMVFIQLWWCVLISGCSRLLIKLCLLWLNWNQVIVRLINVQIVYGCRF